MHEDAEAVEIQCTRDTQAHREATALPLLDLLQLADRAFPTGGFVHSQGLEWLLKHSPIGLREALRMRVEEQLARFDLVFLAHAYEDNPSKLDRRFHAMVMPREARDASAQVGRQFLRNVCDLYPDAMTHLVARLPHCHYPVAFGAAAAALGIPRRVAMLTYGFQTVRGQISAAQRLSRLGQTEAQRLLHATKPSLERATDDALRCSIDDAAPFAPILDVAAMAHERAPVRLFVS